MKKALLAVISALLVISAPLAQGEGPADETKLTLRESLLQMINRDRRQFGLAPVALDPVVSAYADDYCKKQIRNGTTGHFTIDGLAPYMRYSFAGGNDGVSENAAAWSANYKFSAATLYDMIRRSEAAMIGEDPPHDGHRRTILDPYATHVGIGLAWDRGELRITQEFIRRYLDWERSLPRTSMAGERAILRAKPRKGFVVEAITVHHEPLPQPISAITANLISTYSLPDRRREYLPRLKSKMEVAGPFVRELRQEYSDGSRGDFDIADDGTFTFAVPFRDGAGIYTVVVWVHRRGSSESIAASNVSVRVDGVTTAGTR